MGRTGPGREAASRPTRGDPMTADAQPRLPVRHDRDPGEDGLCRSTVTFEDGTAGSVASFMVAFPDQGSRSANLVRAVDEATAPASRFLSHQVTPIAAP